MDHTADIQSNLFQNQIADPKSGVGIFDLPCGYLDRNGTLHKEVQIHEMTGAEEDLLAAKKIKASKKMNSLVAACIDLIGDITDKGKIASIIPQLLLGDRVFLLFAIRRVSFGDDYMINEQCPECDVKSLFTVNLGELQTKEMPDPSQRLYEVELSKGVFKFHPPSGIDEAAMTEMSNGLDDLSMSILMRAVSYNGLPVNLQIIKSLSVRDRNRLRTIFDEVEGGVDTAINFTCASCEHTFKKDVGMDTGFFFPSAVQKRSKNT